MHSFDGVGALGAFSTDVFRIERVENGFVVDMLVTEMESEVSETTGQYLGALFGMAKASMPINEEDKDAAKLPPMPLRQIKRPVRFICATLDDVIERLKQHWGM